MVLMLPGGVPSLPALFWYVTYNRLPSMVMSSGLVALTGADAKRLGCTFGTADSSACAGPAPARQGRAQANQGGDQDTDPRSTCAGRTHSHAPLGGNETLAGLPAGARNVVRVRDLFA